MSGIRRDRAGVSVDHRRLIVRAAVAGGDSARAAGLTAVTRVVISAGSALLVAILAVLVTSSAAVARTQRPHVLTVMAFSADTVRGTGDTPPAGLSAGDSYVSHAKLRDRAGKLVGTYDVTCTITDANDDGNAWSICTTTARIQHRGTLIATGVAELLHVTTSPGGFGVAPPVARFAIIGGTGAYTGARGAVTSTRKPSTRMLSYRYTL
jgi:hypothetical protein